MPRDIDKIIKVGKTRQQFIKEQEAKAKKRKPTRTGKTPTTGTLFAQRNKRLTIREGALRQKQLIITYTKTTNNDTKKYIIAPYSYRVRKLKAGKRKMLYAYDMEAKKIKSFAVRNIKKVALTDRSFKPKWNIEFLVS